MTEPKQLEMPQVHNNGTDGGELLHLYREACGKVASARDALRDAAPHARDYYVKNDDQSFAMAAEQHMLRDKKLMEVAMELGEIIANVQEQVASRNLRNVTEIDIHRLAQEALDVQDACNLAGVVHSFSRAMTSLCKLGLGTSDRNRHPIAILYADKIASLTGSDRGLDFSKAYEECKRLADKS